ncbi:MAG: zinc ribbon domain-containing protein [Clostridia bacterium]|nr:zinc ribbon domain-containing protein [Clostridia bacterium]
MNYFCPNCGKEGYVPGYFCPQCGYKSPAAEAKPQNTTPPVPQPPINQQIPNMKQVKKLQKAKKKGGFGRFLKKLAIFIIVNLTLVFIWFAVGNMITLSIYTSDVADTISSGSLELETSMNSSYDQLPIYVQNMVKKPNTEKGPIVDAMLPYLDAKRVKVNGFFGKSTVVYEISAPDMESFIKGLDGDTIESREQLLDMITEYARTAPRSSRTVEINYHRRGLFSWYGNYDTPEFLDAVTGGINTAYTELYREMMREIEEALKQ